jgi:hypothetical protein
MWDIRRRARRRAGTLAVAESILVLFPIYHGFRPPAVAVFLPLVVALPLILTYVNLWTVDVIHRDAPPPTMPKPRDVLGIVSAMVVAYAMVSWTFSSDAEMAMTSSGAPGWSEQIMRLEADRSAKQKIVDQDLPNVDRDPAVQHLQRQLDETEKAFWEAYRDELCEQDGTCGTRVPGRGKEYYDAVDLRVKIGHKITELRTRLASAQEEVSGRTDRTSRALTEAQSNVAEIDERLERLRSSPPEPRSRVSALISVSREKSAPVILWWVGTLIVFLVIDLIVLRAVVWHVYRRDDGRRGSEEQNLAKQREIDERRALGAKPYPEGGE